MKYGRLLLWGALVCACFFVPATLFAQDSGFNGAQSWQANRIEAGVGGYYQFTKLQSANHKTLLIDNDRGLNAYAGVWLTPWLMLGGEYSQSFTRPEKATLHDLDLKEAGGMIKINLTPDTFPRQYIILGTGYKCWGYTPYLGEKQTGHTPYYRFAFGTEGEFWDFLIIGAQWRASYVPSKEMGLYMVRASKWENTLLFYMSLRL